MLLPENQRNTEQQGKSITLIPLIHLGTYVAAYSGAYSIKEIEEVFGVYYSTVS